MLLLAAATALAAAAVPRHTPTAGRLEMYWLQATVHPAADCLATATDAVPLKLRLRRASFGLSTVGLLTVGLPTHAVATETSTMLAAVGRRELRDCGWGV